MLLTKAMIASSEARLPESLRPPGPGLALDLPTLATQDPATVRRVQSLMADGERPSQLDLERILGTSDMLDLNWLARGLLAARSVCHLTVGLPGGGRAYATGFVVAPGLLMTNHHVLHDEGEAAASVATFNYELDVDGRPKATSRFRLDPAACFFTDPALDFTVVAIGAPDGTGAPVAEFGWLRLIPTTGKVLPQEWMTIVQHPSNEPKQVAARENQLIKLDDPTMWYRTDTAPGSSGAPVFNDTWQVVALHHSGVPDRDGQGRWLAPDGSLAPNRPSEAQVKWVANEGMRVSRIVAKIAADAPGSHLKDAFMATANGEPVPQGRPVSVPLKSGAKESTPVPAAPAAAVQPPGSLVLTQSGGRLTLTMPFAALRSLSADVAAPRRAAEPAPGPEAADERMVLDPDYAGRHGYALDFLGVEVPMPVLGSAAAALAVPVPGGGVELKYHHFSAVMSSDRRMPFFVAANSDRALLGRQGRKALGGGAADR